MWNDKPDGYLIPTRNPTDMDIGTNFYPQLLYWWMDNCFIRPEPDLLPSLLMSGNKSLPKIEAAGRETGEKS
jgi:hypothetical protein